jgi:hypothetical protein
MVDVHHLEAIFMRKHEGPSPHWLFIKREEELFTAAKA